jgi:hypothetical protein
MKHSQKWLDAHKASKAPTFTPEQWSKAEAGLPPLYTGADAPLNDQPIDVEGDTPNQVTAEVKAHSAKGATYVARFVQNGVITLA